MAVQMTNTEHIATNIRWTARILGGINLVFLLFMVGAHISAAIVNPDEARGNDFNSFQEMASFLFFPVSTIIGLFMAMKWDGLGGIITLGGIIAFHSIRPDLFLDPMIDGLAAPSLLFLLYWIISKKSHKVKDIQRNQ